MNMNIELLTKSHLPIPKERLSETECFLSFSRAQVKFRKRIVFDTYIYTYMRHLILVFEIYSKPNRMGKNYVINIPLTIKIFVNEAYVSDFPGISRHGDCVPVKQQLLLLLSLLLCCRLLQGVSIVGCRWSVVAAMLVKAVLKWQRPPST